MDRREKLLNGLDPGQCVGVEIGPLASPIVSRADGQIIYVDHASTEALRAKYADHTAVDTARIVDVDAIWSANTLRQAIGPDCVLRFAGSISWLGSCVRRLGERCGISQ